MSSVEVPQMNSQIVLRSTLNEVFCDEFVRVTETGSFLPPIGMRNVQRPQEHVTSKYVGLKATLTWQDDSGAFNHDEAVGERWNYAYPLTIKHRASDSWDRRTPILHPAVAAVDASQAGYDDAFMRAMANVDILVNVGRDDSKVGVRHMVQRYSKLSYSPYRLLVRGAVLWAICAQNELHELTSTAWRNVDAPQPRHLRDVGAYSQMAVHQVTSMRDVAYVQCNNASQLYMVEIMRALCNSRCPVGTNMTVKEVWPPMNSPYVAYSCPSSVDMGEGHFDSHQVEMTLKNFCDTFDCHDLLEEAMKAVQFFLCRPGNAGVLAGTNTVGWATPVSDMRVGAIGPLLAGVSAEGMKTVPFIFPEAVDYFYGSAVRGCFVTAAYYEALLRFDESHPVARIGGNTRRAGRFRPLTFATGGASFMQKYVRPIATRAGWDCITKSLESLHVQDTKDFADIVFRSARVPWWTNVVLHLAGGGEAFLSTWTKPAQITAHPSSDTWYTYHTLGDVTRHQLAAAVRWMKADVAYSVDSALGQRQWHQVETGTVNRFLPNLEPKVKLGGRTIGVACIKFQPHVNKAIGFLRGLAHSRLIVVKEPEETVLPAAMAMMDEYMDGKPELFAMEYLESSGPAPGPTPADVVPDKVPEADAELPIAQPQPTEEQRIAEDAGLDESIDWSELAIVIESIGQGMTADHLRRTVAGPPHPESPLATYTRHVAGYDICALARKQDFDKQADCLKAYILLAGKLAIHAPTLEVNQELSQHQQCATGMMEAIIERDRPITNWADEVEAEVTARKELAAIEAAERAGTVAVPLARDDPDGKDETLQDFGTAASEGDSPAPTRAASGVADPSQLESIGFAAPPPSPPSTA